MQITILALILLLVSINASMLGVVFEWSGMQPRAARLAGSRLAVVMAFSGAGLLLLGITSIARATRIRRTSHAMAEALLQLPGASGANAHVIDAVGAVLSAEFDGLRMEIVVEPEQGGAMWLRARCSAGQALSIWPRGLGGDGEWSTVATGRAWECVSKDSVSGIRDLDECLNRVFEVGGATHVHHTPQGVEICMPNWPGQSLMDRLALAISAASGLARLNR